MTFAVDEHGFLRSPNLHDGFVDGIQRVRENAVVVSLRDVQGRRFAMQLLGVEALTCSDFRLGNIILDVQIVSGAIPDKRLLGYMFEPPHPAAVREFHDRYEEFLKQKLDKVNEGALILVSIDPSYGCSLTALCTEVKVAPDR